jgi:hypothetical protein
LSARSNRESHADDPTICAASPKRATCGARRAHRSNCAVRLPSVERC